MQAVCSVPAAPLFRPKDPVSAATHFAGFVGAVLFTPVLLTRAAACGASTAALASLSAFAVSMILLYGASAAYHSFHLSPVGEKRLQRLDHMMIFVLIAGSYTPICAVALGGDGGRRLLLLIWALALAGMAAKYFCVGCPKWISSVMYIAMGWLCVLALPALRAALGARGFFWLFAGGVCYTVGGVIYALKPRRLARLIPGFGNHEIFHVFVLLGSAAHSAVMLAYLPL